MIFRRKSKSKLRDAYINWDKGIVVTNPAAVTKYYNKERNRNAT